MFVLVKEGRFEPAVKSPESLSRWVPNPELEALLGRFFKREIGSGMEAFSRNLSVALRTFYAFEKAVPDEFDGKAKLLERSFQGFVIGFLFAEYEFSEKWGLGKFGKSF